MKRIMGVGLLLAIILVPFAHSLATTTSFTFVTPVSRSITLTYGGDCSASAFFFNEFDANFDPDPDGNWIQTKPRAARNLGNTVIVDYNTAGLTNPSSTHRAFYTVNLFSLDVSGPAIGTEVDTNTYSVISADDSDINVLKSTTNGRFSVLQGIFRTTVEKTRVKDLNFVFIGEGVAGSSCQDGTGTEGTVVIYLLNTETNEWDILKTITGSGGAITGVKDAQYGEIYLERDTNVQKYVGFDRNVSYRITGPNAATGVPGCLLTDQIKLRTTEYPVNNDFCQSSTLAPITVTNAGNVDVNIDGNFVVKLDINLALKIWQGTGVGCGSDGNGFGGWETVCSVSTATDPPTATTCVRFTSFTTTESRRLTTKLLIGDSNQLCFSGETFSTVAGPSWVAAGDHNSTFQIGSDVNV